MYRNAFGVPRPSDKPRLAHWGEVTHWRLDEYEISCLRTQVHHAWQAEDEGVNGVIHGMRWAVEVSWQWKEAVVLFFTLGLGVGRVIESQKVILSSHFSQINSIPIVNWSFFRFSQGPSVLIKAQSFCNLQFHTTIQQLKLILHHSTPPEVSSR